MCLLQYNKQILIIFTSIILTTILSVLLEPQNKQKNNSLISSIIQIKLLQHQPEFGYNQNGSLEIKKAQIRVQRSFCCCNTYQVVPMRRPS